jgi:CheY-like chemotaxis protein
MPDSDSKILIVEDNATLRSSFDLVFTSMGFQVRTAEDGVAALQAIREQVPDILLSDLEMPRMSGWELLSEVSRRFPQIRRVAMSGKFSGSAVPTGVDAHAFYEKGGGLWALFRAFEASSFRKEASDDRGNPIWIQESGQDALSEQFFTVSCPECFRTFAHAISDRSSKFFDTSCVYCHSVIVCAVVATAGPLMTEPVLRN